MAKIAKLDNYVWYCITECVMRQSPGNFKMTNSNDVNTAITKMFMCFEILLLLLLF